MGPIHDLLRRDHERLAGLLAALLVPTPTTAIVARIRTLLDVHNAMEEGDEGVYAQCERITSGELAALAQQLERAPLVKLAHYSDGPRVLASIERLLIAAGRGRLGRDTH